MEIEKEGGAKANSKGIIQSHHAIFPQKICLFFWGKWVGLLLKICVRVICLEMIRP